MFGGLALLVSGNMAIAVSGKGGILVRVDPEASDRLQQISTAVPMVMRGREMRRSPRLEADHLRTKRQLEP
jgi:TfoX/Sxy family transcriptional regulator of competence genes